MRLILKENDFIKKGILNYDINPHSGIVTCGLKYTYISNLKEEVISSFTLYPTSVKDVLSFHYRVVGEVKQFDKFSLKVKSKDCSSVKCIISSEDSLIGDVLFDTHNIFLTVWRIDVTMHISGENIRMRWVYG